MKLSNQYSSEERFLSNLKPIKNGCIIWCGYVESGGYGVFDIKNKATKAHRYSFLKFNGELVKGLVIDHICRNKKCVNPKHLRQISQRQNVLENSESTAAINSKKTNCKNGHKLIYPNLLKKKSNQRVCKICWRDYLNKRRKLTIKNKIV